MDNEEKLSVFAYVELSRFIKDRIAKLAEAIDYTMPAAEKIPLYRRLVTGAMKAGDRDNTTLLQLASLQQAKDLNIEAFDLLLAGYFLGASTHNSNGITTKKPQKAEKTASQ